MLIRVPENNVTSLGLIFFRDLLSGDPSYKMEVKMKSDGGLHVPGLCSEEVKSVEDVNQVGFNNEQSANIAELLFSRNFLYVGLFLIVYQDYV